MVESEKQNLRMINMKNHTVHSVVKQYNLIIKNPNTVEKCDLPHDGIFANLVKLEIIDDQGRINPTFDFQTKTVFG
jgi:hypothetical protein